MSKRTTSPPIFDVVKKPELRAKFTNNPELKQQVSTLSGDPEFAAAYDAVQRARRAAKGHEPDYRAKAKALALAEEIRAEKPHITKGKLAELILPDLPTHKTGKPYELETVLDWLR